MKIDLAIHSFSLWHHFKHVPGFGAVAFIDLCQSLGFTGVNLSLNDQNYRHLGGTERWRMDEVRNRLSGANMSLEVDTSGTEPDHLRELIDVAALMRASALRFYTRHRGTPAEMMARTIADLRVVMSHAAEMGVTLVLENHEDFTGPELARIVDEVAHPNLKVLYDFGNSQMVLEDPEVALSAVLPHVHSVHVKDHVMVRPADAPSGQLTVAGVAMGQGFLPIENLLRQLLAQGLRRICFENVWAYSAGIVPGRIAQPGVVLGEGSFRFAKPPFDPALLILDQSRHTGAELVALEKKALDEGLFWFMNLLRKLEVGVGR